MAESAAYQKVIISRASHGKKGRECSERLVVLRKRVVIISGEAAEGTKSFV